MPHTLESADGGREERFRIPRPFGLRRAWTFRRDSPSPKQVRRSKLQRRKLSRILTICGGDNGETACVVGI
ncbi:hypothetical protein FJT64_006725 [Amphibalanus amphitrite]|uniref:Uncharacterized protein n=1 Tax=Amphibalanus amphitrite TaxID=1232801 RepID=A0A6A4VNR1_AMPAM|nr:hypothetical protein FJT64_006725 [Amphibalanus amphitrite]